MKIWKNTKTLDELVPELINTVDAADAELRQSEALRLIFGSY